MVLGYSTVASLNFFSSCPIRALSTMTEKIIENDLKNIPVSQSHLPRWHQGSYAKSRFTCYFTEHVGYIQL